MDASSTTAELTVDWPLPDDVPTLQAMVRELLACVARLRTENAELRNRLDAALKHRFGQRSERTKAKSTPGDDKPKGKRDPHGRAPLPDHLERREVIHDLTEAEKLCPCCGKLRVCIGEQTAEQLDMEPIRFFVLRTVKKTYACRHCSLGAAPPGQPSQTEAQPPASNQTPPEPPRQAAPPAVSQQAQTEQANQVEEPPVGNQPLLLPLSQQGAFSSSQSNEPAPEPLRQTAEPLASNETPAMPSNQSRPAVSKELPPETSSQAAASAGSNPAGQRPPGGVAASLSPQAGSGQVIQTAGPPQVGPIAKGLCGPGLLAHVITSKYADHIPLHRLAEQLSRSGVRIACSTLGGWLAGAADLLKGLYQLMKQRVLLSRVIHSDDTGVKLRVKSKDKTAKAHLWAYIGEADYPYVVFDFTADYSGKGPQTFLEGYKGCLQADALAQYEGLYGADKVKHVCCMAHARRKFVAAAEGGNEIANAALEWIGQLYAIERALPPLLPPSDDPVAQEQRRQREEQRREQRQQQAAPILEEWKQWLDKQKLHALPKTLLGKAIGYALNNWEALCRYKEEGYLAIDNNLSERTLRAIALGRNNWGVIGSETGGETAAVLYTIVGTCKHLGIDPFAYQRETLPALFALGEKPTSEQLLDWLPDRWLLRQAKTAPPKPATG